MSIPKIIHYVWFGRGEKSVLAKKCINSWKKFLPDYRIIEWNEDNFDIQRYQFASDAYKSKKYAYVSDVVRLSVLYEYGGIYMDTDVEVIKSMDDLLHHQGFSGFQSPKEIPTGTMASEKENKWIKDQLDYYNNVTFDLGDVKKNMVTNVEVITEISIRKHNLVLNNQKQELMYGMMMYPVDFFCAKSADTGIVKITDNTYTIHHFAGSWVPKKAKVHKKILILFRKVFGEKISLQLYHVIKKDKGKDK